MSTETSRTVTSPSLRIGQATCDLIRKREPVQTSETERLSSLLHQASADVDATFVLPGPIDWLDQPGAAGEEASAATEPGAWIEDRQAATRTGIVRTYTTKNVTGGQAIPHQLTGVRFTHKDNIGIAGYPLVAGNPALNGQISRATSPLLAAIEAAGGSVIGANHMAEFAMGPTGQNQWFGDGVHPRNPDFLSGGSSSGSGIAVAANRCDVSLGTDTGGSVRLPAAFCGLVGYKPTNGLLSRVGLLPLSDTLDTIGLLARSPELVRATTEVWFCDESVVDVAAQQKLMSAGNVGALGLSHLSLATTSALCDDAVAQAYSIALGRLGKNLTSVEFDDSDVNRKSVAILSVEAARNIGRILRWDWDRLGDAVLARVIRGTAVSAIEYADALTSLADLSKWFTNAIMGKSRFFLTPTSPILAPHRPAGNPDELARAQSDYVRAGRFTRAVNYLGLPAVTVPLPSTADSLNAGLQIVGRPYDDRALLDHAVAIYELVGNR